MLIPPSGKHWHGIETTEVFRLLEVDPRSGMSEDEVKRRREKFGLNQLTARRRRSELVKFLLQFHAPLLYILLAATVVTALLAEWVDAAVIFGVVLVNAIIGYLQESKAERAIEALARSVVTPATVRRDARLPFADSLLTGTPSETTRHPSVRTQGSTYFTGADYDHRAEHRRATEFSGAAAQERGTLSSDG